MIDDEADEQERAEAEALARALEGGQAKAPLESLEAAALLRAVAAPDELSEERAKQVLASLQPELERRVPVKRSRVIGWLVGGTVTALAAAAGLFLYVSSSHESSSGSHVAASPQQVEVRSPLPEPRRELLAAQAAMSAEHVAPEARAAFEREMRAYRVTVLRKLKESYAVQVGMLEPRRAR